MCEWKTGSALHLFARALVTRLFLRLGEAELGLTLDDQPFSLAGRSSLREAVGEAKCFQIGDGRFRSHKRFLF
jgi:hypothetical protein